MYSPNKYNDHTLLYKWIENQKCFEKHKNRLSKIYDKLDDKMVNEFGIPGKQMEDIEVRKKYIDFSRRYTTAEKEYYVTLHNRKLYESILKIQTRQNELKKNSDTFVSRAPQMILRKEKYAKLKNDQVKRDNDYLAYKVSNVNHTSVNFKKWDRQYNKSQEFHKLSKKFELPELERKGQKLIKREFNKAVYHRTDDGYRRIINNVSEIDQKDSVIQHSINIEKTLSKNHHDSINISGNITAICNSTICSKPHLHSKPNMADPMLTTRNSSQENLMGKTFYKKMGKAKPGDSRYTIRSENKNFENIINDIKENVNEYVNMEMELNENKNEDDEKAENNINGVEKDSLTEMEKLKEGLENGIQEKKEEEDIVKIDEKTEKTENKETDKDKKAENIDIVDANAKDA